MTDPRLKLYEMGYTDLVSVAPPGVKISKKSGLKADDLGKRPGKKGGHGWYGYGWLTDEPTRADVARWVQWDSNVGLRGTRFPALDIDSSDPKLTAVIQKLAIEHLGWAPHRIGRSPKTLRFSGSSEVTLKAKVDIVISGRRSIV